MWQNIRIIGFIFLCNILAVQCHAQSGYYIEEPKVFTGGLVLGANFSQVDGDSFYGYHKVGLQVGGVVYIHLTNTIGVSMELNYTEKGSKGEQINESATIGTYVEKYYMHLNYVEVPATIHYKISKLDAEAGLAYARLVKSKEWILADRQTNIDPIRNSFSNTDISYVLGIGCKVYKQLYTNVRFQYSAISIRPIDKVPVGFSYGNQGQYNNLLCVRLMYIF